MPPAGNRGSKLVALGLPVVLVPCEPEAFPEPVAFPDCVDWSLLSLLLLLLSPLCVGLGLSVGLF
jgi:hypothetical protein